MTKRMICAMICLSFLFIGLHPAQAITRNQLMEEEKYYQGELERVQFACISYMLDNLLQSAAVLSAGGAMGAWFDKEMDQDTKELFAGLGLIGIIYCADKISECATVGTKLTSYLAQIEGIQRKLGYVRHQMASLN